MFTHRKFSVYFSLILTLFVVFNFTVWHLYTKKLLTRDDDLATGDLARMGYISSAIHERTNSLTLPRQHITQPDAAIQTDLITIGDSFSRGNGWGPNRYYQDYIATKFNWNVLHIDQFPRTHSYNSTIIALANSGFFEKYPTKYILIESTQRKVVERFSRNQDYELTFPLAELETFYTSQENSDFTLPSISTINNGNFKFVLFNLFYHFSDRAFISNVHKTALNKQLFSIGNGKELLYYHSDITSIKKNTPDSLNTVNQQLNDLAQFLKRKNIQLIFMPAVSKYDLYSEFIVNNKYPKDPFFDIIRPLEKEYIFIDTKAILLEELRKGELDIFFCDDTHWSNKASDAITTHMTNLLPDK